MSLFSQLADCGLFISLILLQASFLFLNRQGLAALSGDVDLVEENVLAVKHKSVPGTELL